MSNMELWNKVCETDPKHTKKVSFGRGFTAIDPMYQIRTATEHLGVAGFDWGWEVVETLFLPNDTVAVRVRLWHSRDGVKVESSFIEQWGQCGLYTDSNKSKDDQDCMKKATTDGLTKCLSCLGFNADVFLGKFDDNRYVAQMNEKFKDDWPPEKREFSFKKTDLDKLIDKINLCEDAGALSACKEEANKEKGNMTPNHIAQVRKAITAKETEFSNRELDGSFQAKGV